MYFLCKVYLVLIILLITSPSFSQEKIVPTYSDFLKIYPNGYPEYSSKVGNSKSIGAYQEYLDDIGFNSFFKTFTLSLCPCSNAITN